MLANLVRVSLALELALYVGAGWWLVQARGWNALAAALAFVAIALGIRLALVCFSTSVSWVLRSPRPPEHQLGFIGTIALVLGEWRSMLADNLVWLPLENVAIRADPPASASQVPVLLVHGYFSNRGMMRPVIRALDAAGIPPRTFNFSNPFATADALVPELEAQVERVLKATGKPRLILVCHSLGGLVARAWMARHGVERVAKVVTVASPHHGTVLAALAIGRNAPQMRRKSAFLAELERQEGDRGPGIAFTSIYTLHDNLVMPQDTSRLAWAKNIALSGLGHVAVLHSAKLHRVLLEELEQG